MHATNVPWHADRRSAQGVRSTTEGESRKQTEESWLSSGRFRLSPATGRVGGSAAFQFYQLDFYVTTQPSLILSWAPRKNRTPSSFSF